MPIQCCTAGFIPDGNEDHQLVIAWPGCAAMLGVLKGMRKTHDIAKIPTVASSSGSFVAAVAAQPNFNCDWAMEKGIEIMNAHNGTERSLGMVGVLGKIVREWIEAILPEDCAQQCSGRTHLMVTQLPTFTTQYISQFASKKELVDCVMASAHLPIVNSHRLFVRIKGKLYVDGGWFWMVKHSLKEHYRFGRNNTLTIKWEDDPESSRDQKEYHRLKPHVDSIRKMYALGEQFAGYYLKQPLMQRLYKDGHLLVTPKGPSPLPDVHKQQDILTPEQVALADAAAPRFKEEARRQKEASKARKRDHHHHTADGGSETSSLEDEQQEPPPRMPQPGPGGELPVQPLEKQREALVTTGHGIGDPSTGQGASGATGSATDGH